MFDKIVCPISFTKINRNIVRINGFVTTLLLVSYVFKGWAWLIVLIAVDYCFRATMKGPASPMTLFAQMIGRLFQVKNRPMGKAAKVFASRIGVCFAVGAAVTHFTSPAIAPVLAGILAFFTFLESVFDFCVGCVMYTYLALPMYRARDAVMSISLFSSLNERALSDVAKRFRQMDFSDGHQFVKEGDSGSELFVIKKGKVEVYHDQPNGERKVIVTYGPREHFGEMSLLFNSPRNANVSAIGPVTAMVLNKAEFNQVLQKYPGMREALEKTVQERMARESKQS